MQLARRFRIPALFCALCVLVCELVSRPYAEMGICDDGSYILIAKTLATTGHIAYNGWASAMLGWQLYLGAAFIKLFGFSFSAVRMSTLLVSLATVVLLQRIFVRAGITERNAVLATLTLVLSPLYLLLSVTYMSDIFGLFAVVICLYGCLRALQAVTPNATILWLCFAVATNAFFGTARQIAWLGILVMLPSTLWLLRAQRRVLIAGSAATIVGALFIFACMQWLKHQLYSTPEHLIPETFPILGTFWTATHFALELPLLLLPILLLFFLRIRKHGLRGVLAVSAVILGYLFLGFYPSRYQSQFWLEPTDNDWVSAHTTFLFTQLHGANPILLPPWLRILLTVASLGGALSLIVSLMDSKPESATPSSARNLPWNQLGVLAAPFAITYSLLLIPRGTGLALSDRYLLPLAVVAMICLARYFQDTVQPQLPLITTLLVGLMALYGVTSTHNVFAFYRARVVLADELHAAGVPDTSVDSGWEYNLNVELQHASHIVYPESLAPGNAFVPPVSSPIGICPMAEFWRTFTPHIHAIYVISFDPDICGGPAPIEPAQYSRWPALTPGTLYVVRNTAPPATR